MTSSSGSRLRKVLTRDGTAIRQCVTRERLDPAYRRVTRSYSVLSSWLPRSSSGWAFGSAHPRWSGEPGRDGRFSGEHAVIAGGGWLLIGLGRLMTGN